MGITLSRPQVDEMMKTEMIIVGMKSTIEKLRLMTEGKAQILSDQELDRLCAFDISNLIRSKPNPKQVGTKDRWECWIEKRDLRRFDCEIAASDRSKK